MVIIGGGCFHSFNVFQWNLESPPPRGFFFRKKKRDFFFLTISRHGWKQSSRNNRKFRRLGPQTRQFHRYTTQFPVVYRHSLPKINFQASKSFVFTNRWNHAWKFEQTSSQINFRDFFRSLCRDLPELVIVFNFFFSFSSRETYSFDSSEEFLPIYLLLRGIFCRWNF